MQPITLIIVDDHELFLTGLQASLEKQKDISVAAIFTSAKNALSYLKKHSVDLVITDISMPEINGVEFIKQLKKKR